LKNSDDYPEGHGPAERPNFLGPHRQRPLDTLRTPDPSTDPARSVALRAQRPPHLNEHILGQAQVEGLATAAPSGLKHDEIGSPVEA
jgi:hypothetical protein